MAVFPGRLCVIAALLVAALPTGACGASETGGLRLVHADEFSILFMEDASPGRARPGGPVEVQTWTFFGEPDRPGRGPGWDTRISRVRVDCQAGMMSPLNHRVFQGETPVDDVTPPYRMQAPTGPEKTATLAWVCEPDRMPTETVVNDLAAARLWADAAWPTLRANR